MNVCYLCRQPTPFVRPAALGNICKECWVLRALLFRNLARARDNVTYAIGRV